MASTLYALEAEWAALAASPRGRRSVRRWRTTHAALAGAVGLDDVLELRRRPGIAGKVLDALVDLAPHDDVAARTLLQALMPGLVKIAMAEASAAGDPNAVEDIIGNAWVLIRDYPRHRRGSVAANILLDARKRYRRDHRAFESLRDVAPPTLAPSAAPSAEDVALSGTSLADVVAACRHASIDDETARLIVRTRFLGESIGDLAAEAGVSRHALTMRRYRAELRLRELPLTG